MAKRTTTQAETPTPKAPSVEGLLETIDSVLEQMEDVSASVIYLEKEKKRLPADLARRVQGAVLRSQAFLDAFATVGKELSEVSDELRNLLQPAPIGKGTAVPVELTDDD